MLVYPNHVSLKFSAAYTVGPLTPVSNMRFVDMVPLVLAGQGTIQAQPPKLLSPTDAKSLNSSIVGHQSGEGLDEVLIAMAYFSTRGGVFRIRKSEAMLVVTELHSKKGHSGCLRYPPASTLEPASPSVASKAF